MIDSPTLLATLQRQLNALLDDLRTRVDTEPAIGEPLRAEYQYAFDAERTAWTFSDWADDRLTQVAVGWLLACVFVRFGEDNHLIDDAMIAGDGARGAEARAAQQDFFRANPHSSDRDYLHYAFRAAAALPGLDGVLGGGHSPLWLVDPSADACTDLLALFRRTDDSGALEIEFTDPELDTRFLGDLYQDLSEHAKKTYALLQTPVFVEEFILDRTLEPALETHGLANTTVIDPTCGSGHFLLGAFDRLWPRWVDVKPSEPLPVIAQRALDAIWGVDLNPFAAAIARFRLLVAALQRCRVTRLGDAPDFTIHVAVGDSLLWGAREQQLPGMEGAALSAEHLFLYATEDAEELRETFGRTYSAVVGNPPYITVKDRALNAAYRARYQSCSGTYSLGVPFTELFFNLADKSNASSDSVAGHVGMITANTFMKREFGKRLIEQFIPKWDLTHVIDTSLPEIPGHNQTVILFGRNQSPMSQTIRLVMGIRGESATPEDPAKGLVWAAILEQVDVPGSESDYISVTDAERSRFGSHPWSIGGGGAAELKEQMSTSANVRLGELVDAIGRTAHTGEDDAFVYSQSSLHTRRLVQMGVPLVNGEDVRDYTLRPAGLALFPYDRTGGTLDSVPSEAEAVVWPLRTNLRSRLNFGQTNEQRGLPWWEYSMFFPERFRSPLSIAYAEVATHNHFVLDRGGKVFKQTAPVLKLPPSASVEDHLSLLALLNSSIVCFWMKQTCYKKSSAHGGGSTDQPFTHQYAFNGTQLQQLPLPASDQAERFGRRLDQLAAAVAAVQPASIAEQGIPTRDRLDEARAQSDGLFSEMVAWQEELDWWCLGLYGLTPESVTVPAGTVPPPLALGERAFEIVLARQIVGGEVETTWFSRHGSEPIVELPTHWPSWYRDLVNRRIDLIASDRNVRLVEAPEHKRRWNRVAWGDLEASALRKWLLDRLEHRPLWFDGDRATVRTVAQLADRLATDEDWMSVARTWKGQVDLDPFTVIPELVADEHVPAQAAARYKESGLKKQAEWKRTWDLQRAEDRGEDVGRIAVPPKYSQADFARTSFWRLRSKLDVPKERFTSVHSAERDASAGDSSMVLAWAGFDHAQLAQALATLLYQRQTVDGWTGDRLVPLIAALDEVLPWVEQWHPEVDPGLGQPLATFYRGQVDQALTSIGATRVTLSEWRPPAPTRGRKKAASSDAMIES